MNKQEVLTSLQAIFEDVLKIKNMAISEEMQAKDVDNWDSLNHALLIDAIEKHFDISFDLMDMISMNTVGEICDKILIKR